jgi:hypothetical protein
MKTEDFNSAMELYADADRRATAGLIEMLTAAVLLKLTPPEKGKAVSVTVSPADLEDVVRTHHFETSYDTDGTMTLILTEITSDS